MPTVWMYWKCTGCGTDGLRGDLKHCPHCGTACRGETDWYLDKNLRVPVTDPDTLRKLQEGPDWECGFCHSLNSAGAKFCISCGGQKGSGQQLDRVELDLSRPDSGGKIHAQHTLAEIPDSAPEENWSNDPISSTSLGQHTSASTFEQSPVKPQTHQRESPYPSFSPERNWKGEQYRDWGRLKWLAIGMLLLAVVAAVVFFITRTHETPVKVVGFSWQRIVHLEKYDWGNTSNLTGCPAGSRNCDSRWEQIGSHQEQDGYREWDTQSCRSVPDGQTCNERCTSNGNGSADCDNVCTTDYKTECETVHHREPKYKTVPDYGYRYYYQIQWWMPSRSPTTNGNDRRAFWPEFILAVGDVPEREGRREESYVITYQTQEEKPIQFVHTVPYSEWIEYNANGEYTATFNNIGTMLEVKAKEQQ